MTKRLPVTKGLREEPMRLVLDLREQLDKAVEDFFAGFPWPVVQTPGLTAWRPGHSGGLPLDLTIPDVRVVERADRYEISAKLPGMTEDEVEVSLSDDKLTIRGEKREQHEEKGRDYHLAERRYGAFSRCFRLPQDVNRETIEATMESGVLTVSLPKKAPSEGKTKEIEIKKT